MDNAKVGKRVCDLLEERGIMKKHVAKVIGRSGCSTSQKLNGHRAFTILELAAIADLLGVTVSELVSEE